MPRTRAHLIGLLGDAELSADQAADRVQVQNVRWRGLQVSVLSGDEKARDQQQRREIAGEQSAEAAWPQPAPREPEQRKRHAERRQLGPQVVAEVGPELIDDAVFEVRSEQ